MEQTNSTGIFGRKERTDGIMLTSTEIQEFLITLCNTSPDRYIFEQLDH